MIPRYKCPVCQRTHGVLPDIIIPYSPYSLRFKLDTIIAYSQRSGSVETLCAELGIAISTLYRWLKKFRDHKALYLGVLADIATPAAQFVHRLRYDSFLSSKLKHFFSIFNTSFLQGPTNTSPPIKHQKNP